VGSRRRKDARAERRCRVDAGPGDDRLDDVTARRRHLVAAVGRLDELARQPLEVVGELAAVGRPYPVAQLGEPDRGVGLDGIDSLTERAEDGESRLVAENANASVARPPTDRRASGESSSAIPVDGRRAA
jgi:hypothetical protein